MTFIEEMQPLIDWCTQPQPQARPRLKRVASASLTRWEIATGGDVSHLERKWDGPLVYWPPRGRHFHGGFSGALPHVSISIPAGGLPRVEYPGQEAHVWLTLTEDDAWIGLQGWDIGAEWREDVHFSWYFAIGEKPEDIQVLMYFYSGEENRFNLALTPSYLFGG